jgi:mono/diheme cytochrome c family protein
MLLGERLRRGVKLALAVSATLAATTTLVGCRQDMQDQPYYEPFEASDVFANGSTNQQPPAGTVARGLLKDDNPHFWFGRDESGQLVDELPAEVEWSQATLERGRQRFEIYCSVCHDSSGGGRGMIVQRGFKQPQPLYEDRLKAKPIGYFFDVASNGFGIMPSYSKQVPTEDRWAIATYVRVLQLSQGSRLEDLPAEVQAEFEHAQEAARHAAAEKAAGDAHEAAGEHGGGH